MKTTTFLKQSIVGVLALLSQLAYSNPNNEINFKKADFVTVDSSVCLQLNGKMPKAGYGIKSTYTVELLHNNTIIKSIRVNDFGDFNFELSKNTWYAVRIKIDNCVPKLISICTHVPERSEKYLHKLYFELDDLINSSEAINLDAEALDFPLAIFNYDNKLENFDYNEAYSANIKKELLINIMGKPSIPYVFTSLDKTAEVEKK